MTITRAWWIVAAGMIVAVPGRIASAVVIRGLEPTVHHALSYAPRALFCVGLAIAALGIVQVVRAAGSAKN